MVYRVKKHKAGFVISDSNVKSGTPLREVMMLSKSTGHSTVIVTDDGTANGKFLGIVTDKDYRPSKDNLDAPIEMNPYKEYLLLHLQVLVFFLHNLLYLFLHQLCIFYFHLIKNLDYFFFLHSLF